jgi:FKBP-type peptidyl-prolyl cis-trans isomerase FklB
MKLRFVMILGFLLVAGAAFAQNPVELKTKNDTLSYCIGMNLGQNFKQQNLDIAPAILSAGIADLKDSKTLLSQEQMMQFLTNFQQEMMAKSQAEKAAQGEVNKKAGEAFLAENAKKEGVKTLPSGLQYKVITEGTGPIPTDKDKVKTHYRGTLIDGKEFDSSYKRGEPAVFPTTGVIKGWTEALLLMKTGSKWMLYIPSGLAYGEQGAGNDIGPNATLIFEIELIGIEK